MTATRIALALVLLTACESDAAKLKRLEEDAALARLEEWSAIRHAAPPESLTAARIRRELAELEVHRFMAGR